MIVRKSRIFHSAPFIEVKRNDSNVAVVAFVFIFRDSTFQDAAPWEVPPGAIVPRAPCLHATGSIQVQESRCIIFSTQFIVEASLD